jgi:tight adherence protein C
MLLAAVLATAFGMLMLVWALTTERDREAVAQAILDDLNQRQKRDPYSDPLRQPLSERLLYPMLQRVGSSVASLTPGGMLRHWDHLLDQAGRPSGLTSESFAALKFFSLAAGFALGAVAMKFFPHHLQAANLRLAHLCGGLLPIGAGLMLPDYLIGARATDRRRRFARGFPDVVDLLVVSVEAGLSLDGAVQEVVERTAGVIGDELRRVLDQISLGVPRGQAWRRLVERLPIPELSAFVAALIQAEQMGTGIAQVLRAQSDALRLRRSLTIREVAAKMPVKMLFPMIFFIFPSVFIVVLGPGGLKIMHAMANM